MKYLAQGWNTGSAPWTLCCPLSGYDSRSRGSREKEGSGDEAGDEEKAERSLWPHSDEMKSCTMAVPWDRFGPCFQRRGNWTC